VNLRKDPSGVRLPADGAPSGVLRLIVPPEDPNSECLVMSEYYIIVKTFNNGSLGSGIDEERSEMR
jgi:hypothetical protein